MHTDSEWYKDGSGTTRRTRGTSITAITRSVSGVREGASTWRTTKASTLHRGAGFAFGARRVASTTPEIATRETAH